jgi:DNA-binding transcriptional LysR family regulator
MIAFVTTAEAGGFSAAARRLSRSPASITRAVAFLEARTGTQLLRRTTRVTKLTEAGERYLAACRRILEELAAADQLEAGERAVPRGVIAVTAPVAFGRIHVRPLVDAFLEAHDEVQARLLLLDRLVNLIDEGIDVRIRIAHMPDSSLLALRVGEVRRTVCASRDYVRRRPEPKKPSDLSKHECIAFSQVTPSDRWTFAGLGGKPTHVKVHPRTTVNSADGAIGSALDGRGVTCVLSYQIESELRDGRLVRLLASFEPEPLPIHVVYPAASAASAKVRAFVDLAVPRLKAALAPFPLPRDRRPRATAGTGRLRS